MAYYQMGKRFETKEELDEFLRNGVARYGKHFIEMLDNYRKDELMRQQYGDDYQLEEKYGSDIYSIMQQQEKEKQEQKAEEEARWKELEMEVDALREKKEKERYGDLFD